MTKDGVVVGVPAPSDVLEVAKSSIAFPTRNLAFPTRNLAFPTRNERPVNDHVNIQIDLYKDYYLKRCLLRCRIGIPLFICTGLSIFLLLSLFLGVNENDKNEKKNIYNVPVIMTCIIGIILTMMCCLISLNKYDNFTQSGLVGYQMRHQTSSSLYV